MPLAEVVLRGAMREATVTLVLEAADNAQPLPPGIRYRVRPRRAPADFKPLVDARTSKAGSRVEEVLAPPEEAEEGAAAAGGGAEGRA